MNRAAGRVRVMIVEDSAAVRELLEHILRADPRFEICASVASAEAALRALPRCRPDVISMDVFLPGMNGLDAVREIMHMRPTPTVVVSGAVREAELAIPMEALKAGALAVVEKPPGPADPGFARVAAHLRNQLALMSGVRVVRQRRLGRTAPRPVSPPPVRARGPHDAVGIVASTGGPGALARLLGALDADFGLPILLVQHIGDGFLDGFVRWLDGLTPLAVRRAAEGEAPAPGTVHVAPPDRHLVLSGGRLRLRSGEPVCFHRPSGTVLLTSLAGELGARAAGVVLTGMGEDGARGLAEIRARGGFTIAEDESTAVIFGMPDAANRLGGACEVLPLDAIAPRLGQLAGRRPAGRGAAR